MDFNQFHFFQKLSPGVPKDVQHQKNAQLANFYSRHGQALSEEKENLNPSQRSLEGDPFSFFQHQLASKLPNQTLQSNDPSSILKIQPPGSVIHQVEFYQGGNETASPGLIYTEGDEIYSNPGPFQTDGSQEQAYQIDPTIQAMFSPGFQDQAITQDDEDASRDMYTEGGYHGEAQAMSPEYLQMFSQFYQMFMQMQAEPSDPNNGSSVFMQMMAHQFLQNQQNPQNAQFQQNRNSVQPQQFDYSNLPLASIPETKDSMLEEQSNWGGMATVKTNKFSTMKSGRGSIINSATQDQCNCCCTCKSRKLSVYQQCSNFNVDSQDHFKHPSQIMSSPAGQFQSDALQQTESWTNQVLDSYFKSLDQNQMSLTGTQHKRVNSIGSVQGTNIIQQFMPQTQTGYKQIVSGTSSPVQDRTMMSPTSQFPQTNQMMSPREQQQNRLIEYMIDNNDFSNYKQRRGLIKGDRMCRTQSRSQSKTHLHQQSNYNQDAGPNFNIHNYYQDQEPTYNNEPGSTDMMCFSNVKDMRTGRDSLHQERNKFFLSPQIQNGRAPQNQGNGSTLNKAKKSAERVKEIRKMNKLQRENPKGRKLKSSQSNVVFEIKDLKKKKEPKKAPQMVQAQSHQALPFNFIQTQSVPNDLYQESEEIHQEQIVSLYSPPFSQNEEIREEIEEAPHTFKSLASVWKKSNTQQVSMIKEHELSGQMGGNNQTQQEELQQQDYYRFSDRFTNMDQKRESRQTGMAVHYVKKPAQNEEYKKIRERLTKYYCDKNKAEAPKKYLELPLQTNANDTMLSMTKTLSSFKSLMMKTMSQMSGQQDHNMQQQYVQGQKQLARKNATDSVNISSIQDDTYSVEMSENLTRMISPKNLYNGQSNLVVGRNARKSHENKHSGRMFQVRNENRNTMNGRPDPSPKPEPKPTCLPNSLFFKGKEGEKSQRKYSENRVEQQKERAKSRQGSVCYCGQFNCNCDSQKDLLGHFQNFLQEMDKHQVSMNNQMRKGFKVYSNRQSLAPSNINSLIPNNTNDFVETNLAYLGRSSSQTSRYCPSNRQSLSIIGQNTNQQMKRFSSGSAFSSFPFNQSTNQHPAPPTTDGQKEIVVERRLGSGQWQSVSPSRNSEENSLEKLDTNKEEELRLVNLENDIMHQAFLVKSHRLNLEDQQRKELLERIQKHKQQVSQTKGMHSQNISSGAVTQTTSVSHLEDHQSHNLPKQRGPGDQSQDTSRQRQRTSEGKSLSLEERRKVSKFRKNLEKIKLKQQAIDQEIMNQR